MSVGIGLNGNGLLLTEENFKTKEEKKSEMYVELERLKKNWDKRNSVTLPEIKTYQKKEYKSEDGDEIKKQVENEQKGLIEQGKLDIQAKSEENKFKIKEKMEKESQNLLTDKGEIESKYNTARQEFLNKAVDQGIARSSIVNSEQERLTDLESQEIKIRENESKIKSDAYNMELAMLESRLDTALKTFEIEQAVKIRERINDLTEDIKKENQKILEYNNKMTELEQKSIKERTDAEQRAKEEARELELYEAKYGYTGDKKSNYEQRLSVAKKYYDNIPRDTALKELENDLDMRDYLGLYYNKLRSYILNK